MRLAATLTLVTALGMGGTYLATEEPVAQAPIIEVAPLPQEEVSLLEQGRRATFGIHLVDYNSGGTAILVGRQKLDTGMYRYRAITAYHVVDDMMDKITKDKVAASHKLNMIFQPSFHGLPLRITVDIDDIDWAIPAHDWASFTFESAHKLDCATLATKAEFEAIKFTDKIYVIGCGGGYAPHMRQGMIGTTHNHHMIKGVSSRMWDQHPERFFKPVVNIWYGDSGGGVFSADGKLIGIVNGFSIQDRWSGLFMSHSGVALKAYLILEVAQNSKDFFKVED